MRQAHVSEEKKENVKEIEELMNRYNVIGIIDLSSVPSPQLQKLRSTLKDKVLIKTTKKRLIKIALENLKEKRKGIEKLEEYLECMPALIFTKEEPFILAKILGKSKSRAPAKAGQVSPKDIIIEKGVTSFTPGPIIGELGQVGIKTGVESGKIVIKEDCLLLKKGDVIDAKKADVLGKLGIEPMEIGLNLVAIYEDGMVYGGDVLSIDEESFVNDLRKAHNEAFNLSVEIVYITKENLDSLIRKAYLSAESLEKSLKIEIKEKEEERKEKKEEKKEEKKVEEVKEEKVEEKKEKKEEKKVDEKKKEEGKVDELQREIQKPRYSEEEGKKAEEIITKMKDQKIEEDQKKGKGG